jgi:hypothetical protein
MSEQSLIKVAFSKWVLMLIFAAAYPIISFISVNKTQLSPLQLYKLTFYFLILLIFALLLVILIKKLILRSFIIERIALGVAIGILVFFSFIPNYFELFILSLLILPIVGLLLSSYKGISNSFLIAIILAVLLPSIQIFLFIIPTLVFSNDGAKEDSDKEKIKLDFVEAENFPNIYHFVPDTYMRNDRVKIVLGYDNEPFTEKLSQLGFYIADKSYSNYPTTFLSLSSLMMMDYVATEEMKPFTNKKKFFDILGGNNEVVHRFKKHGYQFARMAPGRWDPGACNGGEDLCLNQEFSFSELDYAFWDRTPIFRVLLRFNLVPIVSKTTFSDIHKSLKVLDIDGPMFVFGHILLPHPPYVFDSVCNNISMEIHNRELSEEGSWWWNKNSEAMYLNQLKCVNRQLLELVEYITTTDPNSIIIIQADTGTHFGYGNNTDKFIDAKPLSKWTERDIEEQFAILTAIRAPQKYHKWLYPSISPVNIFRFIFSVIEDNKLPFLQDYSYSTNYDYGDAFGKVYKYER